MYVVVLENRLYGTLYRGPYASAEEARKGAEACMGLGWLVTIHTMQK